MYIWPIKGFVQARLEFCGIQCASSLNLEFLKAWSTTLSFAQETWLINQNQVALVWKL